MPGSPAEPQAVVDEDYITTETGLKYHDIELVVEPFFDKLSPDAALNLVDADGLLQRLEEGL